MAATLRILTIVCLALGLTGVRVLPAHAATTWTVTDCTNQYGTGTAGSPSSGSIQWAVNGANTDNDGDTIRFSCSGTISLSSALTVTGSMTIDGSGQSVTLDGKNSVEIFFVSGVPFGLTSLTLAHGSASSGGAIFNNGGTVTIANSTLADNTVSCSEPACVPSGGAIENGGIVTVSDSTFSGNSASGGGAISNYGTVTVTASTFSGNSATHDGGAIENTGSSTLTVSDSTFSGNSAYYGGAISSFATTTVTASTFSGNSVSYTYGGGAIYNEGTVTIGADIIANSTPENCANLGTITDEGYNLDTDGSCTSGKTGDIPGPADLGPLAYNGGPTQTMALLPGSPAIDQIPVGYSFVANNTTYDLCPSKGTDQRGFSRPDAGEAVCDIGAYEYQDGAFVIPSGTDAYDIESSNFSCTGGGTSCVPSGSVASDCLQTVACPGISYGDLEAFGRPNNTIFGIPDELILACVHGTSTGYQIGYLDVVSSQGALDYPAGTRPFPGIYGRADTGAIVGKGTLIGGGGLESNPSQLSSVDASVYDLTTGIIGSVTGLQNTDNNANKLNTGQFRVTIRGKLWAVTTTGTPSITRNTTSSTISCTAGGSHAYDLMNAGLDTVSLAEGESENTLGDNLFLQSIVASLSAT